MKAFLAVCCLGLVGIARAQEGTVIVPITDVRSDQSVPPREHSDAKQETQLLFGEKVNVKLSSGSWVRVEATGQPEFTHDHLWEGYPGWVLATGLSADPYEPNRMVIVKWASVYGKLKEEALRLPLGSRVHVIRSSWRFATIDSGQKRTGVMRKRDLGPLTDTAKGTKRRTGLLATASLLLGDAYVWGGLSPADDHKAAWLSGLDCSGLVHLAYRVHGITIPRDSQEQYFKAKALTRSQLKPGDLIFLSAENNPKKIVHVMLYAGGDNVIEAPQTGESVRRFTVQEKLGVPLSSLEKGQVAKGHSVYFGSFLPD